MMNLYWVANRHWVATCRYPEGGRLMAAQLYLDINKFYILKSYSFCL